MDMKIPEYNTLFHKWYEDRFNEKLTISYTDIYKLLNEENHFMLGEFVKTFQQEFDEYWKERCNTEIDLEKYGF
ncbi:hypothetical protein [Sporosarcina sp. FSL W7-1283]|uniref:hypothetical protein n=1 Tax=Sporosarcina sp. FSL W7-1283 TaxID=2921560 RepID=UPI0030F62FCC